MNKCFYFFSMLALLIAIISYFSPTGNKDNSVPFSSVKDADKAETNDYVSIMTYNIRFKHLDKGKNSWVNRRDKIVKKILQIHPDVFSLQEDTKEQVEYLEEKLLPNYNYLGLMIEAPENHQHNSIFFDRKKLRPLYSANIHLNKDQIPFKKGWDAWESRTATVCLLEYRKEPKHKFFVINAHLDHMGRIARKEGIKIVLETVKKEFGKENYPYFLMGDFNESPKQTVDNYVLENKYIDSYTACKQANMESNSCVFGDMHASSFHYWLGGIVDNFFVKHIFYIIFAINGRSLPEYQRFHLDHLYYKNGNKEIIPLYFSMPSEELYENFDGVYPSDHFPLLALFKFK